MTDSLPPEVERALAGDSAPASAEPEPRPLPAQPGRYQWRDQPIAYEQFSASGIVARGPVLLFGVLTVKSSAGDGICRIYDGVNTSGRRVSTFDLYAVDGGVPAPISNMWTYPAPLMLRNGCFVDLTLNTLEAFVFFLPVREEELVPRLEGPVEAE